MLSFLGTTVGRYVVGAIAIVFAAGLIANHIYQKGKQAERQAAIQRSVTALRDRGQINNETARATAQQLCESLGGSWVPDGTNGECL